MSERVTVKQEGLTLDLLLVKHLGLRGQALIERTLDLNPGLGSAGSILPINTVIDLPDVLLPSETAVQITIVDLFG